jgi:predicted dehydrogenase
MKLLAFIFIIPVIILSGCKDTGKTDFSGKPGEVRLITLNPGHFHSYLVQKSMYEQVDPKVHVYAPEGTEVEHHLTMIESYNTREENPTSWNTVVFTGDDYLERMLAEKKGNVVMLAGNNHLKTEFIKRSVDQGFNVLADKPMAIDREGFNLLKEAFNSAAENNVLLYDIMTSRHNITKTIQADIMNLPELFGEIEQGSPENPSIILENIHYFFKYVSGRILRRPPWFFDVRQQGDGIVDVSTHLVDFAQWSCFPEEIIDYNKDIEMISASRWPTPITRSQFESVTGVPRFPAYLNENVENDTVLQVYANGDMLYTLKDIHVKVSVTWHYRAPEGVEDAHLSFARGSNANVIIRQGAEQNYKPVLYIEQVKPGDDFETVLYREFKGIQQRYPGVELKKLEDSWKVVIPEVYLTGHEAEFAEVTKKYLQYLVDGEMPAWEVPNMISKYYVTTQALEMAKEAIGVNL